MDYLIVGGSIAGRRAARVIRQHDPAAEITIISGEREFYSRPMLPWILDGTKRKEEIVFPKDFKQTEEARVIHDQVDRLDTKEKSVHLATGTVLSYDRLLIATGRSPLPLDVPGGERGHTLRTIKDALGVHESLQTARSAVVVGGGFVGVKASIALRKRGLRVTLVEELPQILSPRLDATGAEIVSDKLDLLGINVRTETAAAEVLPEHVRLTSGELLDADLVVIAIGSSPNKDWLKGSGIRVNLGVQVDEHLQTSVPGVYAAGDVVEAQELLSGQTEVSGLWTNAAEMAKIAGANMAGKEYGYPGFLAVMNATEIEGVPIVTVGDIMGEGDEIHTRRSADGYRKLAFRNGHLVGALFMGSIYKAGIYTALIKNRIPLNGLKSRTIEGKLNYGDLVIRGATATV